MTVRCDFCYAQARMQSRFGQRADEQVWLRLHNVLDLASYLQVAQQTPLRPWVLGVGASHNSHEIELALRQKYRQHVDEVASWMPTDWRMPLQWSKRLLDLPTLQYLLADGIAMQWMKSDPEISAFTVEDPALRLQVMRVAGYDSLVNAWQQGNSMFTGWLSYWKELRPRTTAFNNGLQNIEILLHRQLQMQTNADLDTDYDVLTDSLRILFRRYAFQPAAAFAYLAIIALDIHHVRSDLMQRQLFHGNKDLAEGIPV
jgi:hypothetical protein